LALGQPDDALTLARTQLGLTPEDPVALTAMASVLLAQGDAGQARQVLERALVLAPGHPDPAMALARLALKEGRPDEARGHYLEVLAANPTQSEAILALADLDRQAGRGAQANERLDQALRDNPRDTAVRVALAQAYLDTGDPQQAMGLLHEAPPDQAGDPVLLLNRGAAELAAGQSNSAVESFERLAEQQPGVAGVRYMAASAFAATGGANGMATHLVEAIRLDPRHALAAGVMDRVMKAMPDTGARADLVGRLQAVAPDHPQVRVLAARLALEEGDFPTAIEALTALRSALPDDPRVVEYLFRAQVLAKRFGPATDTALAWLAQRPADLAARSMLAEVYELQGETDKAIASYGEVLARWPDDPVALNNLAMLLRSRAPGRALDLAERAYRRAPRDPDVADTLGLILLAKGEAPRAREVLEPAQAARPDDPALAFHCAQALAAVAGRQSEAMQLLEPISGKDFPEQEQAQALLRRLRAERGERADP
jgi:cellulose synthase operon protein C